MWEVSLSGATEKLDSDWRAEVLWKVSLFGATEKLTSDGWRVVLRGSHYKGRQRIMIVTDGELS